MRNERGFTLLEILLAMIILVVGGTSVISLFAAAVSLQYDATLNQRKALILADLVAEAQMTYDAFPGTPEKPLPPDIARRPAPQFPRDFDVAVSFKEAGAFPPAEGAVANIILFFKGRELPPVERILQRSVFTAKDLETSLSHALEKRLDQQAADQRGKSPDGDSEKVK